MQAVAVESAAHPEVESWQVGGSTELEVWQLRYMAAHLLGGFLPSDMGAAVTSE